MSRSKKKKKIRRSGPSRRAGTRARPLRIGILTCVWQRHALTDLVLGHYAALCAAPPDGAHLELLAVGSEGETSRRLVERHGARYVEHANRPLGAKWNAGLGAMRSLSLDAVLIVGSDDLMDARSLERYVTDLRGGARFLGLLDMYFYDQPSRRLLYWPGYVGPREGETTGLGRCIHRDYLDHVGWRLWEDHLESGLDRSMMGVLAPLLGDPARRAQHLAYRSRTLGFAPVDVKTAVNLWSFDQVAGSGRFEHLDPESVLRAHYPAALIDAIEALDPPSLASPPTAPGPETGASSSAPAYPEAASARVSAARADALVEAGEASFATGDVGGAVDRFREALALDPTHGVALNDLATCLHAQGDVAQAELLFLRASLFDSAPVGPLINLSAIAEARGHFVEAAAYLERCEALTGRTPELMERMAALLAAARAAQAASPSAPPKLADSEGFETYRAAFTELDITPDVTAHDVALQGLWTPTPRVASTVESSLRTQLLLLEDAAGTRCLVVAADIFAFDPSMVARVREWAAIWGLAPEAVLLNASHTHYGPGTFSGAVSGLGAFDPSCAEAIADAIGKALPRLYQELAAATLSRGVTEAQIGFNRRVVQSGSVVMAPNPDGAYERHTPLLLIERADGRRCVVINHGCHPTGLGGAAVASADFVGAFRDALQADTGLDTVLFLQGAAGNIKHGMTEAGRPRWSRDETDTHRAGVRLAEAVAAKLSEPLTTVAGPIRAITQPFSAPLKPRRSPDAVVRDPANAHVAAGMLAEWAREAPSTWPTTERLEATVDCVAVGDLLMCGFPGEPVAELAAAIRDAALSFPARMVLGYTNGLRAYLPTDRIIAEGGYEAHRSHFVYRLPAGFAAGVEGALTGAVGRAADALAGRTAGTPTIIRSRTHKAFFVMSTGRSGTQTLAALLEMATNAKVWHHPKPNLIMETQQAYWSTIDVHRTFWAGRGQIIREAWDAGLIHGETDHNMTPFCEAIAEDVPDARFLVLVRDPREFVRSGMRRGYYVHGNAWDQGRLRPAPGDPFAARFEQYSPFEKVCWLWAETYRRIRRSVEVIGPTRVQVVQFDQLIADAYQTGAVFSFLGLDGFERDRAEEILGRKLNAQQQGDFPRPEAWSEDLARTCWDICGDEAHRWGYPMAYTGRASSTFDAR